MPPSVIYHMNNGLPFGHFSSHLVTLFFLRQQKKPFLSVPVLEREPAFCLRVASFLSLSSSPTASLCKLFLSYKTVPSEAEGESIKEKIRNKTKDGGIGGLGVGREHCGLRGGETGTKMPYDDFSFRLKYMT